MKTNIKTIKISIPSEMIVKRINTTPSLKNLTRSNLKVGDNTENVNHYQFSQIMRMFPICGCTVAEL